MKLLSIDELKPAKGILYSKPHLWRLIKAGSASCPIGRKPHRISRA
jgi:hypothetical protein